MVLTEKETIDEVVTASIHTGKDKFEWICTVDGKLDCDQKLQHVLKYRCAAVYT